jgi:hypothetical protein
MRRMSGSVLLTAALLGAAGLATACGQSGSGSGAIASLSPGKAASLIPSKSESITSSAADWRTRVIDVYAEGQALHDAIWTSPRRGQPADGAAGPRSSGIELRADNLTQHLYTLRESAPDEVQRTRIVDVLVALQAVRSAMEAPADLERRLAVFQSALRGLRASADPSSSSPGPAGSL